MDFAVAFLWTTLVAFADITIGVGGTGCRIAIVTGTRGLAVKVAQTGSPSTVRVADARFVIAVAGRRTTVRIAVFTASITHAVGIITVAGDCSTVWVAVFTAHVTL